MAKIPIILEPGRADGKLATSNAIFDENKGMFQSEINDIQDTLNSDNPNKPLSAKQGKILKELLDNKVIEAGGIPIDTEPIEGNITHLVNSDGLAKEFNKHNTEIILGSVYDISSHNDGAVFESLSALLGSDNLNTLIPTSVRHGGMSIRFVQSSEQSSDNKYVQFRYMGTAVIGNPNPFLNTANWQSMNVDEVPTAGSDNLVKSGGIFSHVIISHNLFKSIGALQPLNNAEDVANFTTGGFYNKNGVLVSDNSFKYQKISIDHTKAYYIKNDNVNEYSISTLVLFDANDNILYTNGGDISIDGIFVFPDFVSAFGTCGTNSRNIVIQEGTVAVKVGKEHLSDDAITYIQSVSASASAAQIALNSKYDFISPISETDITDQALVGSYDEHGVFVSRTGTAYRCQEITIDHSKAYFIKRFGSNYDNINSLMFVDVNDNIIYRSGRDIQIDQRFIFPNTIKKIFLNWYANTASIKLISYKSLDVPIKEGETVFFDTTRNIFRPESISDGLFNAENFYPNYTDYTSYFKIPVSPNTTYNISLNGISSSVASTRVRSFDSSKNYIVDSFKQLTSNKFTTPSNAAFIDIAWSKADINGKTIQIEEGTTVTPYISPYLLKEKYLPIQEISDNSISTDKLQDRAVSLQKTNFSSLGKNLYNKDDLTVGILYNGTIITNGYENYRVSNKIYVEYLETYVVSINGLPGNVLGIRIAMYGADDSIIDYNNSFSGFTIVIDKEEVAYIRISFNTDNPAYDFTKVQIEKGSIVTPFLPYGYYINKEVLPKDTKIYLSEGVEISLPDKIYAVVGDTLQLFYNGMIKAVEPFAFNIITNCSKGAMYPRYWEYTPNVGDIGTTTFTLKVLDNNRNVIATKSCSLITVAAPVSPSSDIHIACFGDSLTAGGYWCHECDRRLIGIGGIPEGNGLSNITFVGSKEKEGTHYHGGSGWTWTSYTTAGELAFRFVLSGSPQLGMNAIYSNNGHQYKIIEIIDNTILCSVIYDGTHTTQENWEHYKPETSGVLTKVSGNGDASLTFTSNSVDSQNPLWDYTNNKMTFIPYANNYCGGQIDVVYVFLTWNSPMTNWKTDYSDMIANLNIFAGTLHSEFPNAKLKLMAVQFPSIKRGMPDYGASGIGHSDVYGMLVSAFYMNKAYQDWCNESEHSSWCEFVNVASQFDSDYSMNIIEKNVNTRCTIKEHVVLNGVHPKIPEGYYQIADVVYRNIVANFCQ